MPLISNTTHIGPVKDNVQKTCEEVIVAAEAANPGHYVNQVYGYDASSTPEHSAGTALDLMVYSDRQLGDWIATYLWDNRGRLGLRWEIWRQAIRSTSPGKTDNWVGMADRGSTTQNHYDHIHCNFIEKDYVGPDGSTSSAGSAVNPALTDWDGSFPGAQAFAIRSNHPAVTKLGEMLVAAGFGGAYKSGPGVPMGPADVENCRAFQLAQGWTGADADGYPGAETWRRLSAGTSQPAPVNVPHPPAERVPETQGFQGNVYLGKLHVGQSDSDSVRVLQQALRNYPGIRTIPLNDSGVTGYYGSETAAMCRLVYKTFNQWQPSGGWGGGNLDEPGPQLLEKLGINIIG